ncbi:MAG: hypothetical protein AB1505_35175 [Candidatus Latescibacterota bacterium]
MRIPFSPSVYEHAARWVGRSPFDVSRDAELLYTGHARRQAGRDDLLIAQLRHHY